MPNSKAIPLCVDLDGTLVKLDTLHQSLFLLLRRKPSCIFHLPGWLLKGKAHLKDQVMQRVALDASALPYNQPLLNHLKQEHANGRKLILATASNYRTAEAVAEHLGLFSEILSSNADTNLRHRRKLAAIQEQYPAFAYAGNDQADFPLWDAAQEIILVNPSIAAKASYSKKADHIFTEQRKTFPMLIKAMRCHQWLKNLLIFTPMLLAHAYTDWLTLKQTTAAFIAFSLAASSIYILNDLFDLSADQHHPRKRKRPFASGDLPISTGALLMPVLVLLSLGIGLLITKAFLGVLIIYYLITTAYSWRIKQVPIADVLTLAVLFTIRLIAGSTATGIPASGWFIEFSIFIFLSLALVKRVSELREIENDPSSDQAKRERGYSVSDLPLLTAFGASSGYIATFVFTLYLNSEKVVQLYSRPTILWLFCPLLLYWITRIWLLASRGQMQDDPLAFAAKDFQTYIIGALSIIAVYFAV